jgi:hypothetical protein
MPRILDSSPVILQTAKPAPAPAPRRSLKRTASAASLPTPPRTRSDKKRLRRDVSDEEEEEEQHFSSDDEAQEQPLARVLFEPKSVTRSAGKAKKPEKPKKSAEDLFWLGLGAEEERTSEPPKAKKKKKAPSTIVSAPVSPPPSRRNQVGPRFQTPTPAHAHTPSTSSSGAGRPVVLREDDNGPIRDTPNNLFLVDSKKAHPKQPPAKDPDSYEEAPTVTYVLYVNLLNCEDIRR